MKLKNIGIKKLVLTGALVLSLSAGSFAMGHGRGEGCPDEGYGRYERGGRSHQGFFKGEGRRGHGRKGFSKGRFMNGLMLEKLDLTDTQKKDVEKIFEQSKIDSIKLKAEIDTLKVKLGSLRKADNTKFADVEKIIDEIGVKKTALKKIHLKNKYEVKKLLTKEQLEKAKKLRDEFRKERMNCFRAERKGDRDNWKHSKKGRKSDGRKHHNGKEQNRFEKYDNDREE